MQKQLIFFAFIFYIHFIQPQQTNSYQQPSVQIHIHAETQSGLDQKNNLDQQAKHASLPTSVVETTVQQKASLGSAHPEEDVPTTVLKYAAGYACPPCALAYYAYKKSIGK